MPSYEEMKKIFNKIDNNIEDKDKKREEERHQELPKRGLTYLDEKAFKKKYFDHPNTMENGTATFFWIVSLIAGALFKDGWMIWVISTFIWLRFITRHNN